MEHDKKYLEQKINEIDEFLKNTNSVIKYNGTYAIFTDEKVNIIKETDEEIYSYIQGYLDAYNNLKKEIEFSKRELEENMIYYEEIIKNLSEESISDEALIQSWFKLIFISFIV